MSDELKFPESWLRPEMPGYGTFPHPFARSGLAYAQTARAVQPHIEQALNLGYRHLDTAFAYRNQDLVGAAIKASKTPRADLFVTSKLHPNNNTYAEALARIKEALEVIWGSSATDGYLDAFLIHYPGVRNPVAAWKGILEARERGWVRHPGVSNFEVRHLCKLHEVYGSYPEINQIELHPYLYWEQKELLAFCRGEGIAIEAYSPLAEGEVLQDPILAAIAQRRGTSIARVALKWCMQQGARPIVGTRNAEHLRANAMPYDFTLTEAEMEAINSLSAGRMVKVSLKWNWDPKTASLGSSEMKAALGTMKRKVFQGLAALAGK